MGDRLEIISNRINQFLAYFAGISLLLIVMLVVGNAVARAVYKPFIGTTEVVGWLSAVATAFGLGYTQIKRGYVEIDALVEHFPQALQRAIKIVVLFISTLFFSLVSLELCSYALKVAGNGNISETLGIVFYPLIFIVAFGFAALTLTLIIDFLKQFKGGYENG